MLLVAEGVACGGVLQTHSGGDIAGVNAVNILAVVGVHLHYAAHALVIILDGVINGSARLHGAGVYAEKAELAHVGIRGDLERQGGEGLLV